MSKQTVTGTHRAQGKHEDPREVLPTETRLLYKPRHEAQETTKMDVPPRGTK